MHPDTPEKQIGNPPNTTSNKHNSRPRSTLKLTMGEIERVEAKLDKLIVSVELVYEILKEMKKKQKESEDFKNEQIY